MLSASWTHHSKVLQYYSLEMFWEKKYHLKGKVCASMQVWVFVYAQSPLFIKAGKRVMISSGCMQITSVQMRALSCTHTVCVCVCVCVCVSCSVLVASSAEDELRDFEAPIFTSCKLGDRHCTGQWRHCLYGLCDTATAVDRHLMRMMITIVVVVVFVVTTI